LIFRRNASVDVCVWVVVNVYSVYLNNSCTSLYLLFFFCFWKTKQLFLFPLTQQKLLNNASIAHTKSATKSDVLSIQCGYKI